MNVVRSTYHAKYSMKMAELYIFLYYKNFVMKDAVAMVIYINALKEVRLIVQLKKNRITPRNSNSRCHIFDKTPVIVVKGNVL